MSTRNIPIAMTMTTIIGTNLLSLFLLGTPSGTPKGILYVCTWRLFEFCPVILCGFIETDLKCFATHFEHIKESKEDNL